MSKSVRVQIDMISQDNSCSRLEFDRFITIQLNTSELVIGFINLSLFLTVSTLKTCSK